MKSSSSRFISDVCIDAPIAGGRLADSAGDDWYGRLPDPKKAVFWALAVQARMTTIAIDARKGSSSMANQVRGFVNLELQRDCNSPDNFGEAKLRRDARPVLAY